MIESNFGCLPGAAASYAGRLMRWTTSIAVTLVSDPHRTQDGRKFSEGRPLQSGIIHT